MKEVINGKYLTSKTELQINDRFVSKHFKNKYGAKKRYQLEKEALIRLSKNSSTPNLIDAIDSARTLHISKLPGRTPEKLTSKDLVKLRIILKDIQRVGVARHSTPIRDVVKNENDIYLVDFERITLKRWWNYPYWALISLTSRYHLLRLVNEHQPHILSSKSKKKLTKIHRYRNLLKKPIMFKKHTKNKYKSYINKVIK